MYENHRQVGETIVVATKTTSAQVLQVKHITKTTSAQVLQVGVHKEVKTAYAQVTSRKYYNNHVRKQNNVPSFGYCVPTETHVSKCLFGLLKIPTKTAKKLF